MCSRGLQTCAKLNPWKFVAKKGAWTYCGYAAGDSSLNLGEMLATGL